MTTTRSSCGWVGSLATILLAAPAGAQTTYSVNIDTTALNGRSGQVVFDWTSSNSSLNSVYITNFTTDGILGLPDTRGGLVCGDLILNVSGPLEQPAATTRIDDGFFFNELAVRFTAFGASVSFQLQVGESHITGELPDEFAFFLLEDDGQSFVTSEDPLGADALFVICVTGQSGGLRQVFSPAVFEEPSTINIVVADVAEPPPGSTGGCGSCANGSAMASMLSLLLLGALGRRIRRSGPRS